jgi:hypothetical protein
MSKTHTSLLMQFLRSVRSIKTIGGKLKNVHITSQWVPLADHQKLKHALFLGTHNSYSTPPVFSRYNQHFMSVRQQLELGVRGFMLDLFSNHNDDIVLCHGSCTGFLAKLQTGSRTPDYQTLQTILTTIAQFLHDHRNEIIFIFLENHTDNHNLDAAIDASCNYDCSMVVTKSDLDGFLQNDNFDITVGKLRALNKRLFIFNSQDTTKYTIEQWSYVKENNYGTTDLALLDSERRESQQSSNVERHLSLMNYFEKITATLEKSMELYSLENIKTLLKSCKIFKKPNFVFVDRIESVILTTPNIFELINKINEPISEKLFE